MSIVGLLTALLCAVLLIGSFIRDARRLRAVPLLNDDRQIPEHAPLISILIPARNEERAIRRAASGALAQCYPTIEVIVVDDGSTDRTAQILAELASDPRLKILSGRPLQAGWVGKCNVCQQLADNAQGEWLLFLDADTAPGPDLTARLLAHARGEQLDMVTVFPFLELGSFWERLILPPFLALIVALFPFERMADPEARPEDVLANGQCIFVRRTAYEAAGGHAAVRNEVLEDVRLAQTFRAAGFRIGGGAALDQLAVRMYMNGSEVRAGLMKNAAAGYRSGGNRSQVAAFRLIFQAWGPIVLSAAGIIRLAQAGDWLGWAILGLGGLCLVSGLLFWGALYQRLYRLSPAWALLWPFGLLGYLTIAAQGMWRVRRGHGVTWKGRTYSG